MGPGQRAGGQEGTATCPHRVCGCMDASAVWTWAPWQSPGSLRSALSSTVHLFTKGSTHEPPGRPPSGAPRGPCSVSQTPSPHGGGQARLVAEREGLVPGIRVRESGARGRWRQPHRKLSRVLGNGVSSRFLPKYPSRASSGLGLGLRPGTMTATLEFLRSLKNTGGETPLLGATVSGGSQTHSFLGSFIHSTVCIKPPCAPSSL